VFIVVSIYFIIDSV